MGKNSLGLFYSGYLDLLDILRFNLYGIMGNI